MRKKRKRRDVAEIDSDGFDSNLWNVRNVLLSLVSLYSHLLLLPFFHPPIKSFGSVVCTKQSKMKDVLPLFLGAFMSFLESFPFDPQCCTQFTHPSLCPCVACYVSSKWPEMPPSRVKRGPLSLIQRGRRCFILFFQ
jgi:hypothetical protein